MPHENKTETNEDLFLFEYVKTLVYKRQKRLGILSAYAEPFHPKTEIQCNAMDDNMAVEGEEKININEDRKNNETKSGITEDIQSQAGNVRKNNTQDRKDSSITTVNGSEKVKCTQEWIKPKKYKKKQISIVDNEKKKIINPFDELTDIEEESNLHKVKGSSKDGRIEDSIGKDNNNINEDIGDTDEKEVDDDLRWHENKYGNNGKGNSSKKKIEIELKYEQKEKEDSLIKTTEEEINEERTFENDRIKSEENRESAYSKEDVRDESVRDMEVSKRLKTLEYII